MRYVFPLLTFLVIFSNSVHGQQIDPKRSTNINVESVKYLPQYFKLSAQDSLKFVKIFPIEFSGIIKSKSDSVKIMDFVSQPEFRSRWRIQDSSRAKISKIINNVNAEELIRVTKALSHLISSTAKDNSWFTDDNLKSLREDTSVINNYLRKLDEPILQYNIPEARNP